MALELIIFIVLVFTVFFNNGVQAYIHYEAYPLIAYVGKPEFATYLKEYEGRLTVPLLLPYGLTLLSNLVLLFIHPAKLTIIMVIVSFVVNASVAAVTMRIATPVYNRVKQSGQGLPKDMEQLMRINLLRLILSTVASLIVVFMLLTVMS